MNAEPSLQIDESWLPLIGHELEKSYFKELTNFLVEERKKHVVYPAESRIFAALNTTSFSDTRVVILGQDPYHGPKQANGLCFSVNNGIPHPPSLLNIFKELRSDLGHPIPLSGNLEPWAKQGVLLLNSTLSVRAHQAGSHQKKGWELFTNEVIRQISMCKKEVVFLLWGRFAQEKQELIDGQRHSILKAAHPSPLSAHQGFFGCKHFSKTNTALQAFGYPAIDWQIERNLFE